MNTNFSEEYKNWIEKLSEENFNELVLNYVKEYFDTKDAYISNGPYDGGLDLIVTKDTKERKKNIQITIQKKGLEKKVLDDCKKAMDNHNKYDYLNKLDFYISSSVTPVKKNELIKIAELDYQIDLRIIDANELGGLASEYKSIRQSIIKFNKTAFPSEDLNINKSTKILFDTLSIGKDVTLLKNNFVQSLIISHLYQVSKATVEEIYDGLKGTFYEKYNKAFFQSEIGKLKSANKVVDIPGVKPKQFQLTEDMLLNLEKVDQNTQIQEACLINDFSEVLKRYNLDQETKKVFEYIFDLYNANYEIDESEVLNESNNHGKRIQHIFSTLISYLQKKHEIDKETSNNIARELLIICNRNDFLNKTSISKMFMNLFKSDKLDVYINTSKRKVYLDTQILLQMICCQYENIEYDNLLYNDVKYFSDIIEQSSVQISLYTTIGYVEEVAWHIYKGLKIERFLELDFIKDLGPSKNVFFNFYLELKKRHDFSFEDFGEFIEDIFDVDIKTCNESYFIETLIQNLVDRLDILGIEVESPPMFDNHEKYRREYEIALSYMKHDQKSYDARKHDLNTILTLSDMHFNSDDGTFSEPFLITWDTSFYEIRKVFKKFTELNHWYIYSPMKFANTISVINLKIDSKAINYNIISLVEENFNLSNETISFLDLITDLSNGADVKKWKLVNKLAKMRKNLLNGIESDDLANKMNNKNLPIDELLFLIQNFYQNPQNKKSYKNLSELFQNDIYADKISALFEKNLSDFQTKTGLKSCIIEEIDLMIKENSDL